MTYLYYLSVLLSCSCRGHLELPHDLTHDVMGGSLVAEGLQTLLHALVELDDLIGAPRGLTGLEALLHFSQLVTALFLVLDDGLDVVGALPRRTGRSHRRTS